MQSQRTKHPEYTLFHSMKGRCLNPNSQHFDCYGGRGIKVCERWLLPNGSGFRNFIADMGPRPSGMTLERLNNDGNYEPENCVWASRKAQAANRRTNVTISFNGETKTATQWAEQLGLRGGDVVLRRLAKGVPMEIALTVKRLKRNMPPSVIDAAADLRRSRTHCKRGHEFTPENTYILKNMRSCRKCKMLAMQAYRSAAA